MTRRTAMASLTATGTSALLERAFGQNPPAPGEEAKPKFGYSAPRRTMPMLCVFSRNLARVHYSGLGDIARDIGFEGVDLTVMIGGHVDPRITNVDLVRAFESIRGSDLEVPMITTSITSPTDPTCYPVLYLTGHSQVTLFRMGQWPFDPSMDLRQRLTQVRRDVVQLIGLSQRCGICPMFANKAGGFIGEATWDSDSVLAGLDPGLIGHMYDPAEAAIEGGLGGWEVALRLALPRLKAVSLQDFYWEKTGNSWAVKKCALGEGMVDWKKFFAYLAAAKFTGPISIAMEYAPKDQPGAMAKDLEFTRKHLQQAWAEAPRS
jgi:hypothetical protein